MGSALRSSFQTTPAPSAQRSDQGRGRPLATPGLNNNAAGPGPVWESNVDPVTQGAIDRVLDHLRQRELAPQFSASGNLVDLSVRLSTALRAIVDDPMLQDDVNIMTAHLVHWMCDYGERSGVDRMSIQLAPLQLSSGQSPVLSVADNGFQVPLVSESRAQNISKRIADPGHHLKLDLKMNAPSARPSATGDLMGPGGGGSAASSGPVAQLMFAGEPVQADHMRPLAHRADLEFLRSNAAQLSVASVSELAGAVARLIDVQVGAVAPSVSSPTALGPQAVMNGGDVPASRLPMMNDPMVQTAQALYPGLAVALPERPVSLVGAAPLPRGMDAPVGPTMSNIMPARAANDPVMQDPLAAPIAGPTTAPIAPTPIAITPSAAPNPLVPRSDIPPASSVTVHPQQPASFEAAPAVVAVAAPIVPDPQSAVPPVASPMPMRTADPVLSVKSAPEPATVVQATAPQTAVLPVSPISAPAAAVDTTVTTLVARPSPVEPSPVVTPTAPANPERALDISSPAAPIVASPGPVRVDDQTPPTARIDVAPTPTIPSSAPVQDRRTDVPPVAPPDIISRADVKAPDAPVNTPPGHQPIFVTPPPPDMTGPRPPIRFPDPIVDRIKPAPPKEPDVDRRPRQPDLRDPEPIRSKDPAKAGGPCCEFCRCAKQMTPEELRASAEMDQIAKNIQGQQHQKTDSSPTWFDQGDIPSTENQGRPGQFNRHAQPGPQKRESPPPPKKDTSSPKIKVQEEDLAALF